MGGVNHCSLHCRLAKFRGLMYRGKYSAVIGRETRIFVCAQYQCPGYGFFLANHSAIFPPVHQTTEFRQTTVRSAPLPISGKYFFLGNNTYDGNSLTFKTSNNKLTIQSVRAGTLNRYLSATLKERLRARGAPKLETRSGHFLEVVIVDFSSAGRHQENFGRTSTKNAQAAQSANAHCNFGAPRALRRSLSVALRYRFSVLARTDCS